MKVSFFAPALTLAAVAIASGQTRLPAPLPGPNVNMVSGTEYPNGDPFLQRQNEPSINHSTRNPSNLLGGSNDYRTVVLGQLINDVVGDSWMGIYYSTNGGLNWRSTLLPGCPYDIAECNLPDVNGRISPLKGKYTAAADSTVRFGPAGLAVVSGLAFNRTANSAASIFVARYLDNNNVERVTGNPFQYIDVREIELGTSGRFPDKPWIATDKPRGGGTCLVAGQTIPAFNVYLVYSVFTGSTSSKIMFARSTNCGATFENPIKVSESNSINQGTNLAIDPITGNVYLTWRRFKSSGNQTDAIVAAVSTDQGRTFPKADEVATIIPFDQGSSGATFRTNTYPTIAVSVEGTTNPVTRAHIVWTARQGGVTGDARLMISSTSNTGRTWSVPVLAEDNYPGRGHQFMPALSFAAGKLYLAYYDHREDSTYGKLVCGTAGCNSVTANEIRQPWGNLALNPPRPGEVFTPFIADARPLLKRHALDVRAGNAPASAAPVFTSSRASSYRFGSLRVPGQTAREVTQLAFNYANLPIFAAGSTPFIGDYIEMSTLNFVQRNGVWDFNWRPGSDSNAMLAYTGNQDVVPPADGNWANYTPRGLPGCLPGQAGTRNQNIYSVRVNAGFGANILSSGKIGANQLSTYVVNLSNFKNSTDTIDLLIESTTASNASFRRLQSVVDLPLKTLPVEVGPRASAARVVFVPAAENPANISVKATSRANGEVISLVLTPDSTNPATPDVAGGEFYDATLSNATIRDLTPDNANTSANILNADIFNADIFNADIFNADIFNADIFNADIFNADIFNADIFNADIFNKSLIDATWTVKNTGKTTTSYNVKMGVRDTATSALKYQLILAKPNKVPTMNPKDLSCGLQERNISVITFSQPLQPGQFPSLLSPNIGEPDLITQSVTNTTIALAPGEEAKLVLRMVGDKTTAQNFVQNNVRPVVVAHPSRVVTLIINQPSSLPTAEKGVFFTYQFNALGANGSLTWSAVNPGSLPPGVTISPTGLLQGTPNAAGNYTFTIQAFDQGLPGVPSQNDSTNVSIQIRDTTPPVLTGALTVNGQPYTPGAWTNQNVVATFTCTDLGSVNPIPVAPITLSLEGANQSATTSCSDGFNTTPLSLGPVNIDKTAPTISLITPAANATYIQGATVASSYSCNGGLSGLGTCTGTVANGAAIDTATTGTKSFTVNSTDAAGNAASPVTVTYQVVRLTINAPFSLPSAEKGVAITPYQFTATNSFGTATWSANPASLPPGLSLSSTGVLSGTPTLAGSFAFALQIADTGASGVPPQTATASIGIVITDTRLPVLTVSATAGGAPFIPGANVWTNQNVIVTFACTDFGGGAVNIAQPSFTVSTEGTAQSVSTTCTDASNNAANLTFGPINIDKTAPVITITAPSGGVNYNLAAAINSNYSCDGGLSGIATCAGPVASGSPINTATVGPKDFTVTASDRAGNTATRTVSYNVVLPYTFNGFFSPLSPAGTFAGYFNRGQNITLKWELLNGATQLTDLSLINSLTVQPNSGCPGTPTGTPATLYPSAQGGTILRASGQYVFNWDTNNLAAGCYTLRLNLTNGQSPTLGIGFN